MATYDDDNNEIDLFDKIFFTHKISYFRRQLVDRIGSVSVRMQQVILLIIVLVWVSFIVDLAFSHEMWWAWTGSVLVATLVLAMGFFAAKRRQTMLLLAFQAVILVWAIISILILAIVMMVAMRLTLLPTYALFFLKWVLSLYAVILSHRLKTLILFGEYMEHQQTAGGPINTAGYGELPIETVDGSFAGAPMVVGVPVMTPIDPPYGSPYAQPGTYAEPNPYAVAPPSPYVDYDPYRVEGSAAPTAGPPPGPQPYV